VSAMTETAETYVKPLPATDALTAPYWKAAAEGRLLIQRCDGCGHRQFYPRAHCTTCGAFDPAWVEASGRGLVHTFSVIHRNGSSGFTEEVPYVFAIVELEEGPRMTANVVGVDPEDVVVDMPVQVTFTKVSDEIGIPHFTKVS
jgi:uncharacterized protein